jgi:CheY-like chemotaxis protein
MEEKINILLVDDNPQNLMALEAVLTCPAYNLVLADSGKTALRCLLQQDFAMILMDVQMPDMDGYETAQHILFCYRIFPRKDPRCFSVCLNTDCLMF